MKKLLSLLMAATVVTGMFGCGEGVEPVVSEERNEQGAYVAYEEKEGLIGRVFFDFDCYEVKKAAKAEIKEVAQKLADVPKRKVTLIAFADSVGDKEYNRQLSERRANAVKEELIKAGVEKGRINVEIRGSKDAEQNVSRKKGAFDRRVDIIAR